MPSTWLGTDNMCFVMRRYNGYIETYEPKRYAIVPVAHACGFVYTNIGATHAIERIWRSTSRYVLQLIRWRSGCNDSCIRSQVRLRNRGKWRIDQKQLQVLQASQSPTVRKSARALNFRIWTSKKCITRRCSRRPTRFAGCPRLSLVVM